MSYDVKKSLPHLYAPGRGGIALVDVPPLHFLQIDGHGDPNTAASYAGAVTTLYTASYAARAVVKARGSMAHVVGPLEALWSAEDPRAFTARAKFDWAWTVMIVQPDAVDEQVVEEALAVARRKGAPAVDAVRFAEYDEGRSVQALHIGSYDDEGPLLASIHDGFMPERGLTWNGRHHEIYLSDPRRTAPEKLRTILRQPVRAVGT